MRVCGLVDGETIDMLGFEGYIERDMGIHTPHSLLYF